MAGVDPDAAEAASRSMIARVAGRRRQGVKDDGDAVVADSKAEPREEVAGVPVVAYLGAVVAQLKG